MTAEIRTAQPADRARMQQVYRDASLSNEGDREALLAHPEVLELDQHSPSTVIVVAEEDGEVVGFASLDISSDPAELVDLFTDPAFMRRGVARSMTAGLVDMARARGITCIEVNGNTHALAFYRAAGFAEIGVVDTELGHGIRMRLALG